MLAAVPAGEYEVRVALDLSPVFGRLARSEIKTIEPPPSDAFDRRLEDLESEDPVVRRRAVTDLPYFGTRRDRVGPALAARLADADGIVRRLVLATLQSFPAEAAGNVEAVLAILEGGEGRVRGERTNAALLLSRTAPASRRTLAVLEKAVAEGSEWEKPIFRSALDAYVTRCPAPGD